MNFYEFFAGGGMARIGLGPAWSCLFANDMDETKAANYRKYFRSSEELRVCDVGKLKTHDLPGDADLAWASFPCQDLSLAGNGMGLNGDRSGTFWVFWRLMQGLKAEGRAPRMIVLENVRGAITSHQGRDLATICEALTREGYRYAPVVIDAQHFLPQSRPRLFIVAFGPDASPCPDLLGKGPCGLLHPVSFGQAYDRLTPEARSSWVWLTMPAPGGKTRKLSDLIEENPQGVDWHSLFDTKRILDLMSPLNLEKVEQAKAERGRRVGAVYKRTRPDERGVKRQRAEVRFDEVAGCLRTPAGGSSRQIILVVEGQSVRSRLLSPREAARLMGLPEDYPLPERHNDAYRLVGDGVAVPVVSWLAQNVIEPSLQLATSEAAA
ncbi:MAG: DNA cytosine methyltransferase [Thermodesulfobacteriota bacterium]